MFSFHDFVMDTVLCMVGREPDYKVRQYALSWYDNGTITTQDIALIDEAIRKQYSPPTVTV